MGAEFSECQGCSGLRYKLSQQTISKYWRRSWQQRVDIESTRNDRDGTTGSSGNRFMIVQSINYSRLTWSQFCGPSCICTVPNEWLWNALRAAEKRNASRRKCPITEHYYCRRTAGQSWAGRLRCRCFSDRLGEVLLVDLYSCLF